jgi:nucleotide-binding universal stress UspA family protein
VTDAVPGLEASFAHVFHPTDFSQASELAFAHALRIALRTDAGLTLFHVDAREEDAHWSDFPAVRSTLARWGLLPPGSGREAVLDLGVSIEKVRAPGGDPVRAILGFLQEDPAELLVLAAHGSTGLERWRKTSVAEPLARAAHSATLFLPDGARGFVSLQDGTVGLHRVLVPLDAAPSAQAALTFADRLARALGAAPELTLLHVGHGRELPPIHVPPDARARVTHRSVDGAVVETIVATARALDADLIVMATRGHDGFLDALRGSTTERVLRQAGCALLAIPES